MPIRHKGGAPRKSPDGLDQVLYVRADQALIDALEERLTKRRKANRGQTLSRADLVREILWSELS